MIFLLCVTYLIVICVQGLLLIRKKYWRELTAFSLLLLLAFILNLLELLDVKIPSPMVGVHYIVDNILHLNY